MKTLFFLLLLLIFLTIGKTIRAQQLYWENIGDFNFVLDLKVNSNGYIFICPEGNGIRRSTNDGETWETLNVPSLNIGNLAVNQDYEIFASDEYHLNNSIYKSDDGGNSWITCILTGGRMRALYISREGYIYAGNEYGRFFKSIDDGITWTSDSVTNYQINCIGSCSNGQIFIGTAGAGIYSSTDLGESWFRVYNPNEVIYSMVINENDYIFVTSFSSVLVSEDYGNNWSPTNIYLSSSCVLGIDTANSIYVSRFGIRKTTDNGQIWIDLGGPDYIRAIEPFGDKIYLGTYSGVFRYDPDVPPPNLLGTEFLPLHINNKWQYLETTYTSDGNSYGLDETVVQFDTLINNIFYYKLNKYDDLIRYSGVDKKLYLRWNDSDYVWVDFNVPLDNEYETFGPGHSYHVVTALGGEHHIFGRDLVYGGYESDMGSSIEDVIFTDSIGITEDYTGLAWGPIWGYDDDIIEAILYDSTGTPVYLTNHYKPVFEITPVITIDTSYLKIDFKIHHHYTRILFDPPPWIGGLDFIDSVKMISYYSKDDSIINNPVIIPYHQNSPVNNDFSINIQLDTILMDMGYTFNYRFTAKDKGIIPEYSSAPDSGYFQCVWQDPVGIKSKLNKPGVFSLYQNYPNPFNPTTKIRYQIADESRVRLIIYDVLGKEVQDLVNEVEPAGAYEVEFDGTKLPSGVYFYRIEAGKYSATKKLLLLK